MYIALLPNRLWYEIRDNQELIRLLKTADKSLGPIRIIEKMDSDENSDVWEEWNFDFSDLIR